MRYECQDCSKTYNVKGEERQENLTCPKCGGHLWPVGGSRPSQDQDSAKQQVLAHLAGAPDKGADAARYPALRGLATLYRIFAFLTPVLALVGAGLVFGQDPTTAVVLAGGGIIIGITQLAFAEAIGLFVDVAHNLHKAVDCSRQTNTLLQEVLGELERKK